MKHFLWMALLLLSSVVQAIEVDTQSKDFKAAVDAYRFWYPTVSLEGLMNGMRELGIQDGKQMLSSQGDASIIAFTANQDTPYSVAVVDLKQGPYVVEMPAGPFMALADDHNQRWIADMGLPGPDAGKGGKYLLVPQSYHGATPQGYYVARSATNKVLFIARIIPQGSDFNSAQAKLADIKIHPLFQTKNPMVVQVVNMNGHKGDLSLLKWEGNIEFWRRLAKIINEEPADPKFQAAYDELKTLGIQKGRTFNPSTANKNFLTRVSAEGRQELLTAALNSNRNDRIRWSDRQWQWLVLSGDPSWATNHDSDPVARDRYFAQAIVVSPAMLKRDPSAGSLYWGAFNDSSGKTFDGSKSYQMTVPLPVPARLFWSVTLYDSNTRSLIDNGTRKSSLRSLFELSDLKGAKSVDLYFGPKAPLGKDKVWIKTMPGKSWFAYIRIYGPDKEAFDGSWKPGDIVEIPSNSMAAK